LTFGGENVVPLYFHTNFIVNPNKDENMTGYIFQDTLCWNLGEVPVGFLVNWPLQVPLNATYLGVQVINGISCTVWQWQETYSEYGASFELYVSAKDSTIVRAITTVPLFYSTVNQIDFSNTIPGPFNPEIYNPPNMDCPPMPFYGWGMTLRNLMNKLRV